MTIWECQTCSKKLPADDEGVVNVSRALYHVSCRAGRRAGLMSYVGEFSARAVARFTVTRPTAPVVKPTKRQRDLLERIEAREFTKRQPGPVGFNRPFERLLLERRKGSQVEQKGTRT